MNRYTGMGNENSIFQALADPTRRKIITLLRQKDYTPGEIGESFTITKASLSHHLDILKRADLVTCERKGQNIYYSLNVNVVEDILTMIFNVFGLDKGKE